MAWPGGRGAGGQLVAWISEKSWVLYIAKYTSAVLTNAFYSFVLVYTFLIKLFHTNHVEAAVLYHSYQTLHSLGAWLLEQKWSGLGYTVYQSPQPLGP